MKKADITKKMGIPSSTLKDWSNSNDWRYDFSQLLQKMTSEELEKIMSRPDVQKRSVKYHRLLHIVNRNTKLDIDLSDIANAFSKSDFQQKSELSHLIVDRFFRECDRDDYQKLLRVPGIDQEGVKLTYAQSPVSRAPFHQEWDNLLGVCSIAEIQKTKKQPKAIEFIEQRRALKNHV